MKYLNIQNIIFVAFMMFAAQSSIAENNADSTEKESAFRSAEVGKHSIKVAKDGTGFIQNFSCNGCGFKILKVTKETRAYIDNANVETAKLVQQVKADVGIVRYALDSNSVQEIRFSH